MKIAIVVPSGDMVHTDFAMCLSLMLMHTLKFSEIETMLINPKTSMVQKGRHDGVSRAIKYNADKILFIDSDQTFPPDALIRLVCRNKDIIGATCRLRQDNVEYSARSRSGGRINMKYLKGVNEVASNGFPFCLINTKVFKAIEEPWFNVSFNEGKWVSEDESFCHAAQDAGYAVYVDADLTKQIGHIGSKNYI